MSHYPHATPSSASTNTDADKPAALTIVREPTHHTRGTYVAAAALCGCRSVCIALIDDE